MVEKTFDLTMEEGGDFVSTNERALVGKAVLTVFKSMDDKDSKVALSAAQTALKMYGKDEPVKKESKVPPLACFSSPEQLAGLIQGLLNMTALAVPKEAEDVQISVLEDDE